MSTSVIVIVIVYHSSAVLWCCWNQKWLTHWLTHSLTTSPIELSWTAKNTVWLYWTIYQEAKKIVLESCHLNSNWWPLAEIFQRLSFFCLMIKGCQSIIFLWFWWNCLWIVIITWKTSLFCETSAFVAHSARKIPWIRLNGWWLLKSSLKTRRPVFNMSCIQGRGFFSKIKYSSFWKHR